MSKKLCNCTTLLAKKFGHFTLDIQFADTKISHFGENFDSEQSKLPLQNTIYTETLSVKMIDLLHPVGYRVTLMRK